MRIKNTRELRLRARGHARADHIEQGTYGESHTNGKPEFTGCAIGCLATPHRQSELRAFIKRLGIFNGVEWELSEEGYDQTDRLRKEFGICKTLARCAEALFEGFEDHGTAINFIPEFAAALNEGADITPQKLKRFWERIDAGHITRGNSLSSFAYNREPNVSLYEDAEDVAPKFLAWLHAQH